jgi:monoamine oxidase
MIRIFRAGVLAPRRSPERIHWANTEPATYMHGIIEGAMRSGARAEEGLAGRRAA